MAEISAKLVMELRAKTGAKMMDAKRALVDTDGNIEKAVELLREKGLAEAGKRMHRATAEGSIVALQNDNSNIAVMVEVNCETDFVAKTEQFISITNQLAAWTMAQSAEIVNADSVPVEIANELKAAISKTGENIQFKRGAKFTSPDGVVESYLHLGGKIGVLVQIDGAQSETVLKLAKDLAMQVAAASPEFLCREEVPAETIEKEKEIYRQLALNEGRPEAMLDKIAEGRLEKYFKENCLIEQSFIKDPDKQVRDVVAEVSKNIGSTLSVARFVRFQLGQE